MTKNELDGFQAILRTKVAELKHLTRHRAEIAVERSADQLEEIQAAFVTSTVNLTSFEMPGPGAPGRRAQTPGGALRRIQDGSFGTCQQCDHDIHPKRLADLPWPHFVYGAGKL